jgi:hypothetical protein
MKRKTHRGKRHSKKHEKSAVRKKREKGEKD